MKTTLFFGLLVLALSFTACDVEREKEITRPHVEPLSADYWADLAAPDTEIKIFDHFGRGGSVVSGLHRLDVLSPDEGRTYQFIGAGVQDFYEAYPAEVRATSPHEGPASAIRAQVPQEIAPYRGDQPQRLSNDCRGAGCREAVREEIARLQKIARQNCLSMVASFNCCQEEQSQEIMVYLTPGVHCEREMLSQKKPIKPGSTY